MLESTNFTFNGVNSDDKGVVLVNVGNGLFQDIFLPNRTLIETTLPYSDTKILKRVAKELPSFPLTLFIEQWRDWNNLRDIARWLDVDKYCEFWTENDPERIYYLTVEGDSQLIHNGCKDGYITLNFKPLYPYALSPVYSVEGIATDGNSYIVNLDNAGDADIRPYVKIRKIGDGDVRIKNTQNNQELIIRDLYNNEEVDIDCEKEIIKSSLEEISNRYLFDNHNDVWLDFAHQTFSEFEFIGNFEFEFTYRLVYKNETV